MFSDSQEKHGNVPLIHGFSTFDRAVHLNHWLMQEGFLTLDDPKNAGNEELFPHVDWSRTQAYSMGLNGIYLNLQGRERDDEVAVQDGRVGVTAAGLDFGHQRHQLLSQSFKNLAVYQLIVDDEHA